MKIENSDRRDTMEKSWTPRCQIRIDNVSDSPLDFVKNLQIKIRSTKQDASVIFDARASGRLINVYDLTSVKWGQGMAN